MQGDTSEGTGGQGQPPPIPRALGMEEGESPGWDGAKGAEPHNRVLQSPDGAMDVPSVQDGSKEFVLMVWRMGMGRGISVWGWEPGRLDPMEWLRLSTAGGN